MIVGSWIYNYIWNKCISPLKLWVRISIRRGVQNYMKFVNDLQQIGGFLRVLRFPPPIKLTATMWLKYCCNRWFSSCPPVSSTNKTDCHDIDEILLKVASITIKQTYHKMNTYTDVDYRQTVILPFLYLSAWAVVDVVLSKIFSDLACTGVRVVLQLYIIVYRYLPCWCIFLCQGDV